MPNHGIVDLFDLGSIPANQVRYQVVFDHRGDRPSTAPAGISVSGAGSAVAKMYGCGHQFEMGVIAMFGIGQDLRERYIEMPNLDLCDLLRICRAIRS